MAVLSWWRGRDLESGHLGSIPSLWSWVTHSTFPGSVFLCFQFLGKYFSWLFPSPPFGSFLSFLFKNGSKRRWEKVRKRRKETSKYWQSRANFHPPIRPCLMRKSWPRKKIQHKTPSFGSKKKSFSWKITKPAQVGGVAVLFSPPHGRCWGSGKK